MIVITVVYASWRVRARSPTISRTVALPRDQTRSITCASREPRNLSSPLRIRFNFPTSPAAITSFCREREVAVREREMEKHDNVTVGRLPLFAAPSHQTGALQCRQVGVRQRLRDVGPHR